MNLPSSKITSEIFSDKQITILNKLPYQELYSFIESINVVSDDIDEGIDYATLIGDDKLCEQLNMCRINLIANIMLLKDIVLEKENCVTFKGSICDIVLN